MYGDAFKNYISIECLFFHMWIREKQTRPDENTTCTHGSTWRHNKLQLKDKFGLKE